MKSPCESIDKEKEGEEREELIERESSILNKTGRKKEGKKIEMIRKRIMSFLDIKKLLDIIEIPPKYILVAPWI
ncbi:MAG: hypothetical protein ACLU8F_06300 [Clostridia bacterium]